MKGQFGSSVRLLIGDDNSYCEIGRGFLAPLKRIVQYMVPLRKFNDRESGLAFWISQVKEIGFLSTLLDEFDEDLEEEDFDHEATLLTNVIDTLETLNWPPRGFVVQFQDTFPAQWDSCRTIIDTINNSKLDFKVSGVTISFPAQGAGGVQLLENPIVIDKKFQDLCLVPSDEDEFVLHRMVTLLGGVNHKLRFVRIAGSRNTAAWDLGDVASLFVRRGNIQKLSFLRLSFEVTTKSNLNNWSFINVDSMEFEECDIAINRNSHSPAATCNTSELEVRIQDEAIFHVFAFPQLRRLELANEYKYGKEATTSRFLEPLIGQLTSLSLFYETWQGCDIFLTPHLFAKSPLKKLAFSVDSPDFNKLSFLKNLQNLEWLMLAISDGPPADPNRAQAFVIEVARSCPRLHTFLCYGLGTSESTFASKDLNQFRASRK